MDNTTFLRRLKILHCNVDSFYLRQHELSLLVEEVKPDVICLNETKRNPIDSIYIPNYKTATRHDISRRQGGVAILTKTNIKYKIINLPTTNDLQILGITVVINNLKTAIICYYNPPDSTIDISIMKTILLANNETIFVGDLNAKHQFFGNKTTNNSGDELFNLIEDQDLILHNDNSPTFFRHNYSEMLDMIISTPNTYKQSWPLVIGPDVGTNHQPVILNIDTTTNPKYDQNQKNKNFNKTDWIKFSKIINLKIETDKPTPLLSITEQTINDLVSWISTTINNTVNSCTPDTKLNHKPNPLPPFIVNKIKLKRKLRRHNQKQWDPNINNTINQLHKEIKKDIKTHKTNIWDDLTSQLNHTKDSKKFWTLFSKLTGSKRTQKSISPILNDQNILTNSDKEKSNIFAQNLEKIHTTNTGPIYDDKFKTCVDDFVKDYAEILNPDLTNNPNKLDINEPITTQEVNSTIGKIKKTNTAPGDDNINYNVIKHLPSKMIQLITETYNICTDTGYYPQPWKTAIGIMIPKPGKDPKIPSNYRPISLLKCIGKIFEKIIASRLLLHLEKHKIINKWQRAYLKEKEANEHVYRLGTQIKHFQSQKQHTGVVLFDVEKAFDSVWHNGIRYKLINYNLPKYITRLLSSYITNREISVKISQDTSHAVQLAAGTPQGSVLSPLIFILYVNDLPINPHNNTHVSQFADDLAIWTSHKNINYIIPRLQRTIDDLELWCSIWRIKLNNNKTQYLSTTKSKSIKQLTVFNNVIKPETKATLLGIIFDQKLTLEKHVDNITTKARRRLNLLRLLRGTNFGANPHSLLRIYKSYIRPVLETGHVLTADASDLQIHRLQIIQNKAIKIAYRLPQTTPTDLIHCTSGISKIKERLTKLKQQSLSRFSKHNLIKETTDLISLYDTN